MSYKLCTKFCITLLFTFYLCSPVLGQNWQNILENNFDIVETFDQLQNWHGETGYIYEINKMPKHLDSSNSIWEYYSNDTPYKDDWIKNHQEYTWTNGNAENGYEYKGNTYHKSLCINYNNFVGGIDGYGPSRLGTFFGNGASSKSGYNKIHVFFMTKFRPGFFALKPDNSNEYAHVGTLKFFDICSGFTDIDYWGDSHEHDMTCNKGQYRREYGLNFSVINLKGGGDSFPNSLYFYEYPQVASNDTGCWKYAANASHRLMDDKTDTFENIYESTKWIGVEIALNLGSVNSANGSIELWLYDENGNEFANFTKKNLKKLVNFDHLINKIVLGGNRFGSGYGEDEGDSNENRYYVDDFIIDDNKIGDTYFSILYYNKNILLSPNNLRTN